VQLPIARLLASRSQAPSQPNDDSAGVPAPSAEVLPGYIGACFTAPLHRTGKVLHSTCNSSPKEVVWDVITAPSADDLELPDSTIDRYILTPATYGPLPSTIELPADTKEDSKQDVDPQKKQEEAPAPRLVRGSTTVVNHWPPIPDPSEFVDLLSGPASQVRVSRPLLFVLFDAPIRDCFCPS
jgi:hypothetical protein